MRGNAQQKVACLFPLLTHVKTSLTFLSFLSFLSTTIDNMTTLATSPAFAFIHAISLDPITARDARCVDRLGAFLFFYSSFATPPLHAPPPLTQSSLRTPASCIPAFDSFSPMQIFSLSMHAFDLANMRGGVIKVRRARPGETMTTLDGKKRHITVLFADIRGYTSFAEGRSPEEHQWEPADKYLEQYEHPLKNTYQVVTAQDLTAAQQAVREVGGDAPARVAAGGEERGCGDHRLDCRAFDR